MTVHALIMHAVKLYLPFTPTHQAQLFRNCEGNCPHAPPLDQPGPPCMPLPWIRPQCPSPGSAPNAPPLDPPPMPLPWICPQCPYPRPGSAPACDYKDLQDSWFKCLKHVQIMHVHWLSNCKMQMSIVYIDYANKWGQSPHCYKTRLSLCGHYCGSTASEGGDLQGQVLQALHNLHCLYRVFQVGCQTDVKVVVTMQTNEANPPIVIKPDSHCVVTTAAVLPLKEVIFRARFFRLFIISIVSTEFFKLVVKLMSRL